MSEPCPICQQPMNPHKDAIWEGVACMTCCDALLTAIFEADRRSASSTSRLKQGVQSIIQTQYQSAREIMVREGAV